MKKLILLLNGALACILLTGFLFAAETSHEAHAVDTLNDIVYPWVNFIILLALLIFFLRKPAKDFFLSRSMQIAREIEQAAQEKHEAEAKYLNYDRRLKNMESEIDSLMQLLKKEGELARKKIVEEAELSSKRIEETTRWIATQEIRKAKETLKEKAIQIITQRAEEFVKKNLQEQDREILVGKALDKLEGAA